MIVKVIVPAGLYLGEGFGSREFGETFDLPDEMANEQIELGNVEAIGQEIVSAVNNYQLDTEAASRVSDFLSRESPAPYTPSVIYDDAPAPEEDESEDDN